MSALPRPFRFGVAAHQAPHAAAWRDLARRTEGLGYATFLVSDHLNPQFAPLPALAAAAAATTTLRIGTQVLAVDFRNPVLAAKEIATLDVLSDGRVDWGMGAGWLPSDFQATGIAFDDGPARAARLVEAVALMKRLFTGERVDHDGPTWSVTGATGTPKPLQAPHPPLLIGAAHRSMLRFAGREADIVSISPQWVSRQFGPRPPSIGVEESMDQQVAWVRESAGDRFGDVELSLTSLPMRVAPTASRTDQELQRAVEATGLTPSQLDVSPHVLWGSAEELCDVLEARRERWGLSNWVIPAGQLDAFAPVVARLAGT